MRIYVLGINHKIAPLEVREKFSFNNKQIRDSLRYFNALEFAEECVIISTCNRMEIYICGQGDSFSFDKLEETLCMLKGENKTNNKKFFYRYTGISAVKHIFEVSAGLNSIVLGEDQILGQVKDALQIAKEEKTSFTVLNTLFREAITCAKKIKTNTKLSKSKISTASIATKIARQSFGYNMENLTAMVIGAGKIGTVVLNHLASSGVKKIFVTKRERSKIKEVASKWDNVYLIDYNERYSVLDKCDIVISATTSPHYTLTAEDVNKNIKTIKPRIFVDLALPRDLDSEIGEGRDAKLINIDDLQQVAHKHIHDRQMEALKAQVIINEAIINFEKWFEFQRVIPVVRTVQDYTDEILQEKISFVSSKLKSTNQSDMDTVKLCMKSTVKELLKTFVYEIKDYAQTEDIETYFKCLANTIEAKKV